MSSPPGFDPRTVQPVAFPYTQYDIPSYKNVVTIISGTLEYTINQCSLYINIYACIAVSADGSGRAVLRRWSTVARWLGLHIRIPPKASTFVCCECCVLSGSVLCVAEVLPTVLRRCIWSRNLVNEEAINHVGARRHNIPPPKIVVSQGKLLMCRALLV
jgi:hypothetical protein